jgi:hypothetical protein
LVFDLLHQDGVDLRGLPLSERKRDLHRFCTKSKVPFMREVQTFPNGELLFAHCDKFGFEGVVSKRLASRYPSGPSRNWVKVKYPGWKRINAERWRIFEGPRKPVLTEAQKTLAKKREELAPGAGVTSQARIARRAVCSAESSRAAVVGGDHGA